MAFAIVTAVISFHRMFEITARISAKQEVTTNNNGNGSKEQLYALGLKKGKKKRPSSVLNNVSNSKEVTFALKSNLCPSRVRAGSGGDGGWWLCSSQSIPPVGSDGDDSSCVVYSFGIRDNFSFDHYLAKRGCTVHGFDPSPDGLSSKAKYEQNNFGQNGGKAVFHSVGLGKDGVYEPGKVPFRWPGMGYLADSNTYTWKLKSLPTIQDKLGNDKITILKVDIEGGEWDVLSDIIDAEWDELYMELHFYPGSFYLFETANDGGLNVVEAHHMSPRAQMPEQNVGKVDRIGLLKKLNDVADMFWWDPNGHDNQCAEIYFRRKR